MNKKTISLLSAAVFAAAAGFNSQAQEHDWAQFGRYAEANKTVPASPKAVFMGDSITDNWDNNDPDFFTDNSFVCRGISGQTTSEMLVRFRRDVIDLAPKYVVIMAGTNDVAQNNGFIAPENTLGNIISMCELARLHKIKPVLCSLPPAKQFGWRKSIVDASSKIGTLNMMIKDYAEKAKIEYVDYHSVLEDGEGGLPAKYSGDGVHPNAACYKIMEEIVLKFL